MAAIEARTKEGKKTKCYALRAISAAFMIAATCPELYVAPYGSFLHHYPYITPPLVTVHTVDDMATRLKLQKKLMDVWVKKRFGEKAPIMMDWMEKDKSVTGIVLCSTFHTLCKTSYIFPILETK